MSRKNIQLLATGVVFILLVAATTIWMLFSPVVNGDQSQKYIIKIKRGMSFDAIVGILHDKEIIKNDDKLKFTARLFGFRDEIKAGKYDVQGGVSSYALLNHLVEGRVANEFITIPEGKNARQIASILSKKIEIDSTRFMQLVNDSNYVHKLGIDAPSLEGFLFPETYNFYWGMTAEDVFSVMVNEFKQNFSDSLQTKVNASDMTKLEFVTLASIIEGETMLDSERKTISAVYHNRLKRGMRLQADPTIQYIIEDGPRRLLKQDLEIDSPYNTYKYPGLPPGPINNPGLASIKASLCPADVDYLYFVANGDGSHTFSRTLSEHLKAKAKFDRYRIKVRNMQRKEGNNGENKKDKQS
ncbi:endolytic transglycosylase MltG [candidate division KSB1 bacterium]|nr:endolytic transglycosylase MltG [candidate division KSB1 bacterium]NIR72564.1 endolytic transglycosylase MltG [candidate division KSB1 bacterium]NIS27316.1 endolytic transglycosylase MltG [candidate division KSB1 bacterium]NIT73526.1 endolytic transglycosylase MltG [candidate division KSB1 bacterium]NIU28046.1 endolytic transglycosylase MltG [candidate division KSB1 bacterium]